MGGDNRNEVLGLAVNVLAKEGITVPATNELDDESRDAGQVHPHCGAQTNGVGAEFVWVEAAAKLWTYMIVSTQVLKRRWLCAHVLVTIGSQFPGDPQLTG